MIEEHEVTLETEHLEEVIEAPPTGQPVVVIQYRSRGVPWYLRSSPAGADSARLRRRLSPGDLARPAGAGAAPVQAQASPGVAATTDAPRLTSAAASDPSPHPFPTTDFGQGSLPLALNSQPIAPAVPATAPASAAAPKAPAPAVVGARRRPARLAPATPPRAAEPAKPSGDGSDPADRRLPPPAPPARDRRDHRRQGRAREARRRGRTPGSARARAPLAVGFSVPADDDNPFAELNIARNPPGTPSRGPRSHGSPGRLQRATRHQGQAAANPRRAPRRHSRRGGREAGRAEAIEQHQGSCPRRAGGRGPGTNRGRSGSLPSRARARS